MGSRRRRSPAQPGIRMDDVAKLAGVSAQTVSRVISRPELVTETTRRVVEHAIFELNYIPNEAARHLASNRSRTVVAIIPTLSTSVYAEEVKQIMSVLEAEGFTTLLGNSEHSIEREEHLIASFLQRRPDAFILTGLRHSSRSKRLLRASGVPIVETWESDGTPLDMAVGFSNIAAGNAMGAYLLERGLRKIGFVGGAFDVDNRARQRHAGFSRALRAAGLVPTATIELPMPTSTSDGILGLDLLLKQAPDVEAIFFSADGLAIPALLECERRGLRIPQQLAICGFGDYDLATIVNPQLTTVHVNAGTMGSRAAELILNRLNGRSNNINKLDIGFQLMERGSA